jgi:hypothetical protein
VKNVGKFVKLNYKLNEYLLVVIALLI